jgi:hypothetical protein
MVDAICRNGAVQIFRHILLRINRGPRSITPFPEEGTRKHAHFLVIATPCARVMLIIIRAIRKRGRGATLKGGRREDRVRAAPAVSRAKSEKNTHTSIQVQRKQSDLPCAMVLRLTSCSPWRPAFCHHRPRDAKHHRELDASNGASEPHDFAVHLTRCSSKAHRRPPHPIPTSVTIAIRPSCGTGCMQ